MSCSSHIPENDQKVACKKVYNKKYYAENKERILARQKRYRTENAEILKSRRKRWYENNRERLARFLTRTVFFCIDSHNPHLPYVNAGLLNQIK